MVLVKRIEYIESTFPMYNKQFTQSYVGKVLRELHYYMKQRPHISECQYRVIMLLF